LFKNEKNLELLFKVPKDHPPTPTVGKPPDGPDFFIIHKTSKDLRENKRKNKEEIFKEFIHRCPCSSCRSSRHG
jgi:hypothetical protein